MKIAVVGAASRSFGPSTIRDILLSDPISGPGVEIALVDTLPERLPEIEAYVTWAAGQLDRRVTLTSGAALAPALDGADFVVAAIEVRRFHYWAQDFHIPRKYGFNQVFGENGGPGGLFHGLRNMGPTVAIAREMERRCPNAILLSFTNPEHKLVEAVSRLTTIQAAGLCHGYYMGLHQIARILERDPAELDAPAAGINHFSWFQSIRDRKTGQDLYPELRRRERGGDLLHDWHELGMSRILFRRFGLWPSPGPNHFGEYVGWADEFVASEMQFFYDPSDGCAWDVAPEPEFVYSLTHSPNARPWKRGDSVPGRLEDAPLRSSGELAIPIMEAVGLGLSREIPDVNIPNRGAVPNLPPDMVVEIPVAAGRSGFQRIAMEPLPEAIAAMLRLQGTINELLVRAFAERNPDYLLQAILLDPTVHSYRGAVEMMKEMLELQRDILPFGPRV